MDFRITLTGSSPLVMNNARMADPLNPALKALKALTGKRQKTDADHEAIYRVEHSGALYHDADIGPYLPGDNIWKAVLEGAMKHRLGTKVREGVIVTTEINPLAYPGPRDIAGLWDDENFRYINFRVTGSGSRRNRVSFCRPIFRQWRTAAEGVFDEGIIDLAELRLAAETAGQRVGVCDWRPRYGRFTAQVEAI